MNRTEYSGIACKIRAMYGNCLKKADFDRLAGMKTVGDVAGYLKTCPGYGAMIVLPNGEYSRRRLEDALAQSLKAEFSRLYRFSGDMDRRYLLFYVKELERLQILRVLHRLISGIEPQEETSSAPLHWSGSDYNALSNCTSFKELLQTVKNSIYWDTLHRVALDPYSQLPDYTEVDHLLQAAYFTAFSRFIQKNYAGALKKSLLFSLGAEIDWANIVNIMRMKRYFPQNTLDGSMIFPGGNLGAEKTSGLVSVQSEEAAFSILKASHYGDVFRRHSLPYIEQYRHHWMYRYSRKFIKNGEASPYLIQAYMEAKSLEKKQLTTLIECVHYGRSFYDMPTAHFL